MASVVRHGKRWRAHVYAAGRRESRVFATQREAATWADKRQQELLGGPSLTFTQAAERWLAWKLPQLDNAGNQRTVEQSIRDWVLPTIGTKRLSDLARRDLIGVVKAVADKGRIETAHRVGQRIRAILDHAVDHGDIQAHPGAGLSRVLPHVEANRIRAIAPGELPDLLRAIAGYPELVTRIGLMLLAHTFVRTSELRGAEWSEVNGDTWVIPEGRMKLRKLHVVPISAPVRALLDELAAITGDGRYMLASARADAPISSNTLLFALYRLGYRGRMTGHGFRSVASSVLNESGLWSRDAIERQLAHRETDRVREAYMRAEFLDERRRMMTWWSGYLAAKASSTAE